MGGLSTALFFSLLFSFVKHAYGFRGAVLVCGKEEEAKDAEEAKLVPTVVIVDREDGGKVKEGSEEVKEESVGW